MILLYLSNYYIFESTFMFSGSLGLGLFQNINTIKDIL